jgi:hypothetical protein
MSTRTEQGLIEQARAREWFYAYELPDGSTTPTYHGLDIQAIHDTRWRMLRDCLDERFGPPADTYRSGLSALDLACHQGWFAVKLAQSGFGRVRCIDARAAHVADSRLIADIYGLDGLVFSQGDIHALDAAELGSFDVVLMLACSTISRTRSVRCALAARCAATCASSKPGRCRASAATSTTAATSRAAEGQLRHHRRRAKPRSEASITGICLVPSLEALDGAAESRVFPRLGAAAAG